MTGGGRRCARSLWPLTCVLGDLITSGELQIRESDLAWEYLWSDHQRRISLADLVRDFQSTD